MSYDIYSFSAHLQIMMEASFGQELSNKQQRIGTGFRVHFQSISTAENLRITDWENLVKTCLKSLFIKMISHRQKECNKHFQLNK